MVLGLTYTFYDQGVLYPQPCDETSNTCKLFSCTNFVPLKMDFQWRYIQMATRFLYHLLRRDVAPSQELAKFFLRQAISPQPVTRSTAQRYYLLLIKMNRYLFLKFCQWSCQAVGICENPDLL